MISISIQGNIGAGKSTIIDYLKSITCGINVCAEPLDKWLAYKQPNGETLNLLAEYYADPSATVFKFQSIVIETFADIIHTHDGGIFERGADATVNVFAKNALLCRQLTHVEYEKLQSLCAQVKKFDGYVFLKCDAKILFDRVHNIRRRPEESTISLEYLQALEQLHENWAEDLRIRGVPVLELWATNSVRDNCDKIYGFYNDLVTRKEYITLTPLYK